MTEPEPPNQPIDPAGESADVSNDAAATVDDSQLGVVAPTDPTEHIRASIPVGPTGSTDEEPDKADPIELSNPSDASGFTDEQLEIAADRWQFEEVEAGATVSPQMPPHQPPFNQPAPPHQPPHQPPPPHQPAPPSPHQAPPFQPPPNGAAPPVRKLYRSNDRKLGGVSAGVAEYFNVDPTLVRLGTLALAVSGVGIFIYIVAWLILPDRPEGYVSAAHPPIVANDRTLSIAFGIAALALVFGVVTESWEAFAIALIGGGIWLLSERAPEAAYVGVPGPAAAYGGYEPPSGDMRFAGTTDPTAPSWSPQAAPTVAPSPSRKRTPQTITWVVLSMLALVAAVGIAASAGNWWDAGPAPYWGIGLVIIGIGVVAGQIQRGGARGLIPLGILTALMLFPVTAVDGTLNDGIGESFYQPTTIADLQNSYELGIGQLTVDLTQLDLAGQDESINIDLGIGELIVIIPASVGGQASIDVNAGEITHQLGASSQAGYEDGLNIEQNNLIFSGEDGTLNLDIHVGLGAAELRVEQDA